MNMRSISILFVITVVSFFELYTEDRWGVVTVPVADMTIRPAETFTEDTSARDFFNSIPLSIEHETERCPRAYQTLFNQRVKVITVTEDQVQCEVPILIYGEDVETGELLRTFWTLKEYVQLLDDLENSAIETIPPVKFDDETRIIALVRPVYENETETYFSMGTRFIGLPGSDTDDAYGAVFFDHKENRIVSFLISKESGILERQMAPEDSQRLFVQLLNNLIDQSAPDIIPFAWGGGSITHYYAEVPAQCVWNMYNNIFCGQWIRQEAYYPHSGFDASSIVFVVAQLAGLSYPFKKSDIVVKYLEPLHSDESLTAGDLLWMPQGLMVISSIEKNEIIAARGYFMGYGKVVRLPFKKVFNNISTIDELVQVYIDGQELEMLNAEGKVYTTVNDFKLLKLLSTKNILFYKC